MQPSRWLAQNSWPLDLHHPNLPQAEVLISQFSTQAWLFFLPPKVVHTVLVLDESEVRWSSTSPVD